MSDYSKCPDCKKNHRSGGRLCESCYESRIKDLTRKRDALQAELKAASERSETLRKERDDFREKWQYENARRRDDEGVWLATRDANKELTEKRDALQATVAAKWSYRLTTPPPPDPPGISYPNLSETYKLEVIDTGHSDRILLLESKELSERIKQLEATVEKCRAAGFIDEKGEVRKVLGNRWHCSYCDSVYAEYCNGCPRCHLGESGTSTSLRVVLLVSTTEAAERAKGGGDV